MDILFVTYHYLSGNGGGVYASRAYINAFASLYNHVTLLYPYKQGRECECIDANVECIPVLYNKPKVVKFCDLLFGRVHRYYDIFKKIIASRKFDIVVFDNSRSSFGLIDEAHKYGAKVVTIHHNCEYEYVRDNSKFYLKYLNLFWVKRYEEYAIKHSDLNFTLTKQDADTFNNKYGCYDKIKVLGCFEYNNKLSAIDVDTVSNSSVTHNFVITGNLSASQTVNSLIPWLQDYYPVMLKELKSFKLTIAGKSPNSKIVSICSNLGIELIPSPVDMQPILAQADVYVCPTALGGGLKLRIMDGLKNGLPVITHKISARGYDEFVARGILFSYDDIDTFRKCLKSISNITFDRKENIKIYNSVFSFQSGMKRMQGYIEKM